MDTVEDQNAAEGPGRAVVKATWWVLLFFVHLAAVYALARIALVRMVAILYGQILPWFGAHPEASLVEFVVAHLVLFCAVCGLGAGALASVFRHTAARFVWIVPCASLVYQFIHYPASLFENHFTIAWQHFFGYIYGGEGYYVQLWDQLRATGPAYVGIAYSAANLLGALLKLQVPGSATVLEKVRALRR